MKMKEVMFILLVLFVGWLSGCGSAKKAPKLVISDIHTDRVNTVSFRADSRYALSGSGDSIVRLWDVATGRNLFSFEGHDGEITSVAFSPDGQRALSAASDTTLRLWDIATGREIRILHGEKLFTVQLWFRSNSGPIQDDYTRQLKEKRILTTHITLSQLNNGNISDDLQSDFEKHGNTLSQNVIVLEKNEKEQLQKITRLQSSDKNWSTTDKKWLIYDVDGTKVYHTWKEGDKLNIYSGHKAAVTAVAFSPDAGYAISGSQDGTFKLWEIKTGREIHSICGHENAVTSLAFSQDGDYFLSGSADKTLKLWDAKTAQEIQPFAGHAQEVTSVVFSTDGKRVLSGSADRTLKLWDVETAEVIQTFLGHGDTVTSVAFSGDGSNVLSGSADKTLKLWDVKTAQAIQTFSEHAKEVTSVAFSRDEQFALSGYVDGALKRWSFSTGSNQDFSEYAGAVTLVRFDPKGRYLFSVESPLQAAFTFTP